MTRLFLLLTFLVPAAFAPAAAQDDQKSGPVLRAHLWQGTVPESSATISGVRFIVAGSSGFGVEGMIEAQGGLIESFFETNYQEYAAFNFQLGLVKRFGGPGSALVPYVSGGWYPAFERTGDEILSNTSLFYGNAGAELNLFKSFGVFAETGLGLSESSTPFILRFGISG